MNSLFVTWNNYGSIIIFNNSLLIFSFSRSFTLDPLYFSQNRSEFTFSYANSLSVSWIHDVFIFKYANFFLICCLFREFTREVLIFLSIFFREFNVFLTFFVKALEILSFSRRYFELTINSANSLLIYSLFANSLWIHYVFHAITMNSLSLTLNHYAFSIFNANSLSFPRNYHESNVIFVAY